jgi:hypothetical protein
VVVGTAVLLARGDILDVAVITVVDARNARGEAVTERAGHRALNDRLVVTPVSQADIAVERAGRLVRDELHRAAGGIAAEQRALRPAQCLHPSEVENRETRRSDRAGVAIVLIDRDRRFLLVAIVVLRNPAHVEHDLRGAIGVVLEVGDRRNHVDRAGDAAVLDVLLAQHRNRDADVLQPLFALLRGDNDIAFGRSLFALWGILGQGRSGAEPKGNGAQRKSCAREAGGAVHGGGAHHGSVPLDCRASQGCSHPDSPILWSCACQDAAY